MQEVRKMATIRKVEIPERYCPGFAALVSLTGEEHERLARAVAQVKPSLYRGIVSDAIATEAGFGRDRARSIIETLISLYTLRSLHPEKQPAVVAWDLVEAVKIQELGAPPDEDWDTFASRLEKLISFDSTIGMTSKAIDVMTQHQNVYCNSETKIITDIRPVFSGDPEATPPAAVVIHNLKIAFHKPSGDTAAEFVALDAIDLRQLKALIERAEKKEKSLQSYLGSTEIRYLDPLEKRDGNPS